MAEPSALKPGKLQNRPMVLRFSAWATQCFSQQFVQQRMQFLEQILCLCKLIIASSTVLQGVTLVGSPNVKAKQVTMRF